MRFVWPLIGRVVTRKKEITMASLQPGTKGGGGDVKRFLQYVPESPRKQEEKKAQQGQSESLREKERKRGRLGTRRMAQGLAKKAVQTGASK